MSKDHDKKTDIAIERAEPSSPAALDALPEVGSPERLLAEKKLVRKLDSRLLPTIFLIYIMNYIDVRSHFSCKKLELTSRRETELPLLGCKDFSKI
jgi:proteasome assembly chaperone (PAC2) family protein